MATKTEKLQALKRKMLKTSIDDGVGQIYRDPIAVMARDLTRKILVLRPATTPSDDGIDLERLLEWPHIGQFNRSVASVGANVVEGLGKSDPVDLLRFFRTARGSAYEALYWADLLDVDFTHEIEILADLVDAAILEILDKFNIIDSFD